MFSKKSQFENVLFSNFSYPLLVASLGLGTISLGQFGSANLRIWEVLTAIFIILVIVKYCAGERFISPNRVAMPILLPLMLSVLLSGLNAFNSDLWGKQASLLLLMFILYLIASQRFSRVQILQNIRWIIYPSILVAGWGILELLLYPEELVTYYSADGTIQPRVRSFFAEPNEFSQFLALPFAFLFSALIYHRKRPSWESWIFGLGLMLVVIAQVLSFSRGGMLVFMSEIFAWFILALKFRSGVNHSVTNRKVILLLILLVTIVILLTVSDVGGVAEIFIERMTGLFSGDDPTSKIRWEGIILAIEYTISSPINFIVGMGLGNLTVLLGDRVATTANLLVDVFSELGMLGLLSFLAILCAALILPLATLKRLMLKKDDEMLVAFFGAYLSFVGLIVGGLTYATHMLNFFWFSSGILFALYHYNKTAVISEKKYK